MRVSTEIETSSRRCHALANRMTGSASVTTDAGFTFLELLIAVAVAAVLSMAAVPSLKALIHGGWTTSQTNDFVGTLNFARSEAIKRGTTFTLCASNQVPGSTTTASCSTTDSWDKGWLAYVGPYTQTPTILRVHKDFTGGNNRSVLSGSDTNVTPNVLYFGQFISFLPSGRAYLASGVTVGCFFLTDTTLKKVTVIKISQGGRIRSVSITLPATGTAIPCI